MAYLNRIMHVDNINKEDLVANVTDFGFEVDMDRWDKHGWIRFKLQNSRHDLVITAGEAYNWRGKMVSFWIMVGRNQIKREINQTLSEEFK